MSLSVYDQFKELTPSEQQYITAHPHHAFAIKNSKEAAFEETKRRFGFNGRNDKSDAFRHCFWSAVLAREIGYAGARRFTTAHNLRHSIQRSKKTWISITTAWVSQLEEQEAPTTF